LNQACFAGYIHCDLHDATVLFLSHSGFTMPSCQRSVSAIVPIMLYLHDDRPTCIIKPPHLHPHRHLHASTPRISLTPAQTGSPRSSIHHTHPNNVHSHTSHRLESPAHPHPHAPRLVRPPHPSPSQCHPISDSALPSTARNPVPSSASRPAPSRNPS